MTSPEPLKTRFPAHRIWIGLAILVALGYLFGLGGDHIPRNGDELVYAHIARLTAETGKWLPLVSSYDFMRNTKPPVLFWQAMVAGGWGEHWTLLNLRLPSIAYTWGIALMTALLAWKTVQGETAPADRRRHALAMGAIAAIVYLSFFSTYRYGRPYPTSAPETFWLFGVLFAVAWSPAKLLASRWAFPLLAGIAIGIGCLYKSFVMVVPVGFALALCYQVLGARKAPWDVFRRGVVVDGVKVVAICLLALAIFGLWFAIDPQPRRGLARIRGRRERRQDELVKRLLRHRLQRQQRHPDHTDGLLLQRAVPAARRGRLHLGGVESLAPAQRHGTNHQRHRKKPCGSGCWPSRWCSWCPRSVPRAT